MPNELWTNTPALRAIYDDLGRDFYAVYCASSDGKNFRGDPCPAWADLPEAVRGHWAVVAHRALEWAGDLAITPNHSLAHLPDPEAGLTVYRRYADSTTLMHMQVATGMANTERRKAHEALGTMRCPRRDENPGPFAGNDQPTPDHWQDRDGRQACSYCGSLEPDAFMALATFGNPVEPTDKSYKAYIRTEKGTSKFYFQHLSDAQKVEFVRLVNDKVMVIDEPGRFYRLPFFMTRTTSPVVPQ